MSKGRRGRGSTRAAGWGSRWAASGRLRGSSSRSRAGSGAAAQPGPRAAGGTRRGVPQTPASTSSPSTVSVSGAGGGHEGGRGGVGWGRGEVRGGWAAFGGRGLEGCPRVGAESAAIWASHGRRGTPLPPPGWQRLGAAAAASTNRGLRDPGLTVLLSWDRTGRLWNCGWYPQGGKDEGRYELRFRRWEDKLVVNDPGTSGALRNWEIGTESLRYLWWQCVLY